MTHRSSHIIIQLAKTALSLEDRLEHLSDEKREKILEVAQKATRDLRQALGD